MSEAAERGMPVSGPLSVTPVYAAASDELVTWDGSSWNELAVGGSAGPINLTGDVLGTGTSTVATTVLGLQGHPVSSTAPLDSQVLGWSAGQWRPVPAATVTGGGSPPGGAVGTVQINAGGGNFGGITMSGDATMTSGGALSLSTMPGLIAGPYQGITFDPKGRATAAVDMNAMRRWPTRTLPGCRQRRPPRPAPTQPSSPPPRMSIASTRRAPISKTPGRR